MTALGDVVDWLHDVERRRSQHVVTVAGGYGLLHDDFPAAHDHNKLSVHRSCDPDALARSADLVLGGAQRDHRLIDVLNASLADQLTAGLSKHGYSRHDGLLMLWNGRGTRERPTGHVETLDLPARAKVAEQSWRQHLPDADPGVWHQLGYRVTTLQQAVDPTFLAVRAPDGGVAARVDLYLRDRIAQVEEVFTEERYRGQGHASLLILDAVEQARDTGARVVFLLAEATDWPQHLYRRLGFTDLGLTSSFTR